MGFRLANKCKYHAKCRTFRLLRITISDTYNLKSKNLLLHFTHIFSPMKIVWIATVLSGSASQSSSLINLAKDNVEYQLKNDQGLQCSKSAKKSDLHKRCSLKRSIFEKEKKLKHVDC